MSNKCRAKSRDRGIYNGSTGSKPIHKELPGKDNNGTDLMCNLYEPRLLTT